MIKTETCTVITCDRCGDGFDDGDELGTPHFPSVEAARTSDWFEDWEWTDTEQVCPRCVTARLCEAKGHDWGPWKSWPRDPMEVVRFCQRERCHAHDTTVATGSTS